MAHHPVCVPNVITDGELRRFSRDIFADLHRHDAGLAATLLLGLRGGISLRPSGGDHRVRDEMGSFE